MPSNLIGVVGPNGCGKSNIIDAVRWVMGETSAKMLRGASMTDVIFSGSSTRKPVGMATVELIFDNSDGQLKGEYAQYNEVSVKRQVSRDGQSVGGDSIMGLLMLAAAKGSTIDVTCEGAEAEGLMNCLANLVETKFGEGN